MRPDAYVPGTPSTSAATTFQFPANLCCETLADRRDAGTIKQSA